MLVFIQHCQHVSRIYIDLFQQQNEQINLHKFALMTVSVLPKLWAIIRDLLPQLSIYLPGNVINVGTGVTGESVALWPFFHH